MRSNFNIRHIVFVRIWIVQAGYSELVVEVEEEAIFLTLGIVYFIQRGRCLFRRKARPP